MILMPSLHNFQHWRAAFAGLLVSERMHNRFDCILQYLAVSVFFFCINHSTLCILEQIISDEKKNRIKLQYLSLSLHYAIRLKL